LIAQSTGSNLAVVGNYVAPNALIITFFPAALYLAFKFFWMPSFVVHMNKTTEAIMNALINKLIINHHLYHINFYLYLKLYLTNK